MAFRWLMFWKNSYFHQQGIAPNNPLKLDLRLTNPAPVIGPIVNVINYKNSLEPKGL